MGTRRGLGQRRGVGWGSSASQSSAGLPALHTALSNNSHLPQPLTFATTTTHNCHNHFTSCQSLLCTLDWCNYIVIVIGLIIHLSANACSVHLTDVILIVIVIVVIITIIVTIINNKDDDDTDDNKNNNNNNNNNNNRCPAHDELGTCGTSLVSPKLSVLRIDWCAHEKLKCWLTAALFKSRNCYFNSETSSWHWTFKLRNVRGQSKRVSTLWRYFGSPLMAGTLIGNHDKACCSQDCPLQPSVQNDHLQCVHLRKLVQVQFQYAYFSTCMYTSSYIQTHAKHCKNCKWSCAYVSTSREHRMLWTEACSSYEQ